MLKIVVSLTDDCRGAIYDCNMFIVLATKEFLSTKNWNQLKKRPVTVTDDAERYKTYSDVVHSLNQ
jgi:hypothetical protein